MNKIKVGIIGMGYIGVSHIEALNRISGVDICAVADANYELAKQRAEQFGISRCFASMDELIADPEIQAIHNCTPNFLHTQVNERAILAGKHIFSEKPLARSSRENEPVLEALKAHPEVVAGVNFCYRMYPLIQDAKNRIAAGEIGRPYLVHGSYLQDWLLHDTDYNWRIEREYTGDSRCVADIGSHWIDLAQVLMGCRIVEVCAAMDTVMPVRKKPARQVESFAKNDPNAEYTEIKVDTEDCACMLLRFADGTTGTMLCSQVSAGRKCYIDIEVDGSDASFHWNHEMGDRMWKGNRDSSNEEILRNPNLMTPQAAQYSHLGAGHAEGWNDAFKNNIQAFYDFIRSGKQLGKDKPDFATFEEGHYILKLTDAILKSGREKRWVRIDEV